ncbi:MAG: hypothetical protein ICV66_12725 [Chitinophagaceae bacterium]|nr:hypothetical protein [Chitinophagaceae bacterium]
MKMKASFSFLVEMSAINLSVGCNLYPIQHSNIMEWLFPVYNYTEKRLVNFRISDIFSDSYRNAFEEFIHYYVPDLIATVPDRIPKLKPRHERVCRFCKRDATQVKFRKDAHVIPQITGNKFLIHNSECDECNARFSLFETSFAEHIGMFRTTDGLMGQRGIPKFKNQGLSAYSEKDETGKYNIFIEAALSDKAIRNEKDDTIIFKTTKGPFTPLFVMKTLFKIGYSLLHESEIDNYYHINRILNTSEFDNKLYNYCNVLAFTFSKSITKPFVVTYRRRQEFADEPIPSKIVMLYFGRFMYEFVLLNSKDDFMIRKDGKARILYCPPYWNKNDETPTQRLIDFSSPVPTRQEESFLFRFDPSNNEKTE